MLSTAQLLLLKAGILAETDPEFVAMRTAGATGAMAIWLNGPHPTAKVWSPQASWEVVQNAIDYSKYTPSAANLPTDIAGLCRLVAIFIKLTVQQNMLIGMVNGVNARRDSNVKALLDTVTQIPSGASGNNVNPGALNGANVAAAISRPAKRAEALFINSTSTNGGVTAANNLSFEGSLSDADVVAAVNYTP